MLLNNTQACCNFLLNKAYRIFSTLLDERHEYNLRLAMQYGNPHHGSLVLSRLA